jgi:hypothetical protein
MTGTVWLVVANLVALELRMEFYQLQHPLNATVLCDRKGCEQVADYLEVDDHGHEYGQQNAFFAVADAETKS